MKTATASWTARKTIGLFALGATLAGPVRVELSAEQLAKMAQNPIGNLISLPFQDNINFVDFYIQNENPGPVKESNWVPAPKDKFILVMRLYWPKERDPSILDGSWKIPQVRAIE